MLCFLPASRSISKTIENAAAIMSARAKSSRLHQKPSPNPVTHKTSPSPSPIFPFVILLNSTIPIPNTSPKILSYKDKDEVNGMQMQISKAQSITIHTFIFLVNKSWTAVAKRSSPIKALNAYSYIYYPPPHRLHGSKCPTWDTGTCRIVLFIPGQSALI